MKLLYIIFLITINISAQTFEIDYKYHELLQPKNLPRDEVHKLINIDNDISYYVVDKEQNHSNVPGYTAPTESEALRTFKKFNQDSVYTVYPVGLKYAYVKEKIPVINWKIEKETKKILDYDCRKATAEYRGRKFEAYFTEKISTTDGPWKFSGLPGTILEVYDTEKKLTIEAIAVKISRETKNYDQYLSRLNVKRKYTYEEFAKLSVKRHLKILAAINSSLPNNSDVSSTSNLIKNYPQEIEIIDVEKYK
ncbi:GLPGLI family protein [Chryseobacterium indologenes]|uniref:GLPGLI family protein n=1 Tax=Chryseobacterium indologenes TaxID=253 RepID=A0A411DNH1_CHRID|nr:GLPGLI family protein [Chryseobacterium indologenes]